MVFFNKLNGPVFYKESNDAREQLEQFKSCYENASGNIRNQIELDMKLLNYGIIGEDTVSFELRNSFMPMVILHNLYLKHDGLTAQIDYLVITKKLIFIIECKNLFGNIEINNKGDFIRTLEFDGRKTREGIYSPITQNQRHMDLLRKQRRDNKSSLLSKLMFDKYFDDNYKSIVVLANPKTVIDMKYAKKEIKQQIIRSDQLISYMKQMIEESKNATASDAQMYELAESFLSLHKENQTDYLKRYGAPKSIDIISQGKEAQDNLEAAPIYQELKAYRLNKSREEGIKAYYVYNNAQLEELINKMPNSLTELKSISGFGHVKCEKYGNEILQIIDRYIKE